jgi:GT2 family glycosyltransferase
VVVATWNRPDLLRGLVAQLCRQDYADHEVVIVDDGSEPPVASHDSLGFPSRVRLLRQPNAGPASARHRGILEASGDLVILLDDDMVVGPGFVAAHARRHDEVPGSGVVLGEIRPDPELRGLPLFERFHALMRERFARDLAAGTVALRGIHLLTGNVSFRRSDYLRIGGFDSTLDRSEDVELGIRFEKAGLKLSLSREAFSVHRSDHTSLRVWLGRAFRYGINDCRIGRKHEDEPAASPWRFLRLMHPVARPLLLTSVVAPPLGFLLARAGMAIAQWFDRLGLERVALAGTTVVYGIEYFRGLRHETGSLVRAIAEYRDYRARLEPAAGRAP